jgi:hypothetical protein
MICIHFSELGTAYGFVKALISRDYTADYRTWRYSSIHSQLSLKTKRNLALKFKYSAMKTCWCVNTDTFITQTPETGKCQVFILAPVPWLRCLVAGSLSLWPGFDRRPGHAGLAEDKVSYAYFGSPL